MQLIITDMSKYENNDAMNTCFDAMTFFKHDYNSKLITDQLFNLSNNSAKFNRYDIFYILSNIEINEKEIGGKSL